MLYPQVSQIQGKKKEKKDYYKGKSMSFHNLLESVPQLGDTVQRKLSKNLSQFVTLQESWICKSQ